MYEDIPSPMGATAMMNYGEEKMSEEDEMAYGSMDNKYRAENDVHTLKEAKKIKEDKKRMKMVIHCAKMKAKELNAIAKEKGSHNSHGSHKSSY